MKILNGIKLVVVLFACTMLINSCDYFEDEIVTYKESSKSIVGEWKIISAHRNDVDISALMDFSSFRVIFNEDKSYSIENYLPFVVAKEGTYNLDDPQYPFHILFNQQGDNQPVETLLDFSIVGAERQIGLTFSPGCISNTYTYILEKVQ